MNSPYSVGSRTTLSRSTVFSRARRHATMSATVRMRRPCRRAKTFKSGRRAISPSAFMTSQMTATVRSPAMRIKSTAASVWPVRRNTPPSTACNGKMWPGRSKSPAPLRGSASVRTVRARSAALMPVVVPSRASTLTVKAVR